MFAITSCQHRAGRMGQPRNVFEVISETFNSLTVMQIDQQYNIRIVCKLWVRNVLWILWRYLQIYMKPLGCVVVGVPL
jgi:hypothetical protein